MPGDPTINNCVTVGESHCSQAPCPHQQNEGLHQMASKLSTLWKPAIYFSEYHR